jgi:1-deoxy-D-xylulose-5-phosphate reductoisomerase
MTLFPDPHQAPACQNLLLVGSTGSIGESTLKVVRRHPGRFRIVGLTANGNWQRLEQQAREFNPRWVHVGEESWALLRRALADTDVEVLCGRHELVQLPAREGCDTLVLAIVGTRGLEPLMTAIRANRRICFANKEPLVTAGELVMREVRQRGLTCLPIDSEHSAILQCLRGEDPASVRRVILTASGGPFRSASLEEFRGATREQALKHPTWEMGAKITIDSATMMNKALEVIEARWLYDLPGERIDVLIHPQSIVHSMVEFQDRSIKAQLGLPDMRIPIQYALSYPEHLDLDMETVDWVGLGALTFEAVDERKFRALPLARQALAQGGGAPCVLNAANEAAVELFLDGGIPFAGINDLVEFALESCQGRAESLEELIELDRQTRIRVLERAGR